MGSHSHKHSLDDDKTQLAPCTRKLGLILIVLGLIGIAAGYGASLTTPQHGQRFFWALLFAVAGFLCISCAALIFVLINHLVRAGWITNVRRILEVFAMQIPLMGVLLLPIIIVTGLTMRVDHDGHAQSYVYSWAVPDGTKVEHHAPGYITEPATHGEHDDHPADHAKTPADHSHAGDSKTDSHATDAKDHAGHAQHAPVLDTDARFQTGVAEKLRDEQVMPGIDRHYDSLIAGKRGNWLIPWFWAVRIVAYLAILSAIGWYFYSRSVRQDLSGDVDISQKLLTIAGPILLAAGLIVTFIAFDVFMSLDPHWFSTMFGVYYFASGTQALWACMILTCLILQARGYLTVSVTKEHYHDMGKFMFAFVVFFAYIGFSQYMLQWYANLPEETFWFDKRGYSTMYPNGYSPLVLILLIGRFVIPFLGTVSRHTKRHKFAIGFWSVWLLVCFFVDMYLIVMPEFSRTPLFGLPEICCLAGAGLLWVGSSVWMLASHALRPVKDPRTHESVVLQNF